jgi:hypothetical protein
MARYLNPYSLLTQNIREYLGHVNGLKVELSDIKTKRNLEIVRDIFLELKMTKETNLINKDLEVLEKKK